MLPYAVAYVASDIFLLADLQAVHFFNLMSSPSAMPRQAQHIMSAADSKLFVLLIGYKCRRCCAADE
eukprot:scaffold38615_cov155-Skeletonema_dohrnii-CCMP3373.AAC.3